MRGVDKDGGKYNELGMALYNQARTSGWYGNKAIQQELEWGLKSDVMINVTGRDFEPGPPGMSDYTPNWQGRTWYNVAASGFAKFLNQLGFDIEPRAPTADVQLSGSAIKLSQPGTDFGEATSKVLAHEVGAHVRLQDGSEADQHKAFESQEANLKLFGDQ